MPFEERVCAHAGMLLRPILPAAGDLRRHEKAAGRSGRPSGAGICRESGEREVVEVT